MSWGVVFRVRQRLKGSLWFVPFLGGVLGAALGQLDLLLDHTVQVPEPWRYSASTASEVLSVLVGAMVALLGFVITVSVLVVQMATGALSPRFMRLWYRDLLQKVVLADLVGSLTFSFALLRHIEENSVPNIGVTAAGTTVAVSLLLLLLYVNRFTHLLRPVAVAAVVARAGRKVIGELPVTEVAPGTDGVLPTVAETRPSMVVRAKRPGTIQAIHAEGLIGFARRNDCVLVLPRAVGDFVPTGASVVEVFGNGQIPRARRLRGMFALGVERTVDQDPAFALRILVDIAVMALSPAVNAPTTTVQVLDYIEDLLLAIGGRELAGYGELHDADGRLRVVVPVRRWQDYLELAVTEIRRYGVRSVQVSRRLRAMLEELRGAVRPAHRAAVEVELRKLDADVADCFRADADQALAASSDRQGIGGPPGSPRPSVRHGR